MKKPLRRLVALSAGALTASFAAAHPGDHETLSASENALHVATDPWHVFLALAAAVCVVTLLRRERSRRR